MTRLSVNLNKIALLRNSRNIGIPSVLRVAELSVGAGAHGVTVHPRPDRRHIRPSDVYDLADFLENYPQVEFNIEGNPFPEFMEMARRIKPVQCTLVPDGPDAIISDHVWDLDQEGQWLALIIAELRDLGARVSIFVDADSDQWGKARELGADRVELYTQPYAEAFARNDFDTVFEKYAVAAKAAQSTGRLRNSKEWTRRNYKISFGPGKIYNSRTYWQPS